MKQSRIAIECKEIDRQLKCWAEMRKIEREQARAAAKLRAICSRHIVDSQLEIASFQMQRLTGGNNIVHKTDLHDDL